MSRCSHVRVEASGPYQRYFDCSETATHFVTFAGEPNGFPFCLAHATELANEIESRRLPDEEPCGVTAARIVNGIALQPEVAS